jgi:hypothetical protein
VRRRGVAFAVVALCSARADALRAALIRLHRSPTRSFCRACIFSALARKEECPLDRRALTQATLVPNRMVAAYLAELPVRCSHAAAAAEEAGAAAPDEIDAFGAGECAWTGALGALSEHLRTDCAAETVACPHAAAGCDALFSRRDANAHAAACVHALVACAVPGCAARVARGVMDAHMRDAAAEHVPLLQAALAAMQRRAHAAERHALDESDRADGAENRAAAFRDALSHLGGASGTPAGAGYASGFITVGSPADGGYGGGGAIYGGSEAFADDAPAGGGAGGGAGGVAPAAGGASCYKCGSGSHWSRVCPFEHGAGAGGGGGYGGGVYGGGGYGGGGFRTGACVAFRREGGCDRGASCRFTH